MATRVQRKIVLFGVLAVLLANTVLVFGQSAGPTSQNCYSAQYRAASDCDRLASGGTAVGAATITRGEQAEAAHWEYLRKTFTGTTSPYLVPVTGD